MKPIPDPRSCLEAELRHGRPGAPLPKDLHSSILQAVRTAASTQSFQPTPPFYRWVTISALASLAALFVWNWASSPKKEEPAWTAAALALEQTHNMPQQASLAMLSPLSKELESLDHDVRKAVDVLIASVP